MSKKKVNIIILNYNGKELLEKYLPSVVEASGNSAHDCKVTVIDNKSTDKSVDFIRSGFKGVNIYKMEENRLLCSFNNCLREIDDDIVIFLNTDIKVDAHFVDPLVRHFKDKDLFFVAPRELSMEGEYQGNMNRLVFKLGLLSTEVVRENHMEPQYDIYVHGGAFDRQKFLYLGGYDDIYLPGIVEDLDLCYRGWKCGWKGLYDPESFYYHEGSTTFNAEFGISGRRLLAYRNSFLFFWKNITSGKLFFVHVISLPFLLASSLVRGRGLIAKGFFSALRKIPELIRKRKEAVPQFILKDEEVAEKVNLPLQVS